MSKKLTHVGIPGIDTFPRSEYNCLLDLYTQAPSCMGVLNGPDHVYQMANPLYLKLINKKDIIGKTVKEVLPELESQGILKFLDDVYTTGETFSATEMLVKFDLHGNGQLVNTYLNCNCQAHRNSEDNIDGIFFFTTDVTEQVLSRKKIAEDAKLYRLMVETAQEGIWLIDEKNKTTFVNKKLCEIFEYSEEEMLGREIYDFMDAEGKELAATYMARKKEGELAQLHFKYIAKSGKGIWTNISTNPLFSEDGCYQGALALVTLVPDRITLERQLVEEQRNKHKEITRAVMDAQEKERRELGEELHDNVNQLLVAAKLFLGHSLNVTEGSKPFVLKSEQYLSTAMEAIRKLTQSLVGPAKEHEMGLIYSINELLHDMTLIRDVRINFTHDTYREEEAGEDLKFVIYRIIQQQMGNILKHSEATLIIIDIRNQDDRLNLLIRDNGKGFDTSATLPGIGLNNIRNRAEIYNGEVNIESSPGEGCTVSISFLQLK